VRPFAKEMHIMIWGEPLLNKDIIAMISYASKFSKTAISTNGILVNHDIAEKLITSGLSDLIVSVDGSTQDVYEKYRVGGNLNKALDALRILYDYNVRHGNNVNIIPQFIVFKHNQHEMDDFKNICTEIGLKPLFKAPYLRAESIFENSDYAEYVRETFDTITNLRKAMCGCQDPKKVFTILMDGTVVACSADHNGETNFGNIITQEVSEIWSSLKYRTFRKKMLQGNAPNSCLSNCLQYCLKANKK
jgi:radical SAM protein with 4Fe4S-binding SPASM domain